MDLKYTKKQNQIDKFAKVGRATNEDIISYYNSRIATGSLTGNKDWIIWTDIFTEIIKDKSLTLDEANRMVEFYRSCGSPAELV